MTNVKKELIFIRIKQISRFFSKKEMDIYLNSNKNIRLIYENLKLNMEKNKIYVKNFCIKALVENLKKIRFNSDIVGSLMKKQIEDRIPFKKVLQNSLKLSKKEKLKGIKLQISGRLNGNEIARTEWIKYGQIPLHSFRTNIDYCSCITFLILLLK